MKGLSILLFFAAFAANGQNRSVHVTKYRDTIIDNHGGYFEFSPGILISDTTRRGVLYYQSVNFYDSIAGWRLPTQKEMELLFGNRNLKIEPGYYWSQGDSTVVCRMWGRFAVVVPSSMQEPRCYVRLVRKQ